MAGCGGCGGRAKSVDHMVVRLSAGGWRIYAMGKEGDVLTILDEAWPNSAHAQGAADALGLGVPVLIR